MAEIRASLSLEDNFSAQIKKAIEGTDEFAQSITKTKNKMKDLSSQRFEATIKAKDEATEKINKAKKVMESIKKNVAVTIAAKDAASASIRRVGGDLKLLGSKTFSPIIKAKDEASSVIRTVTDKLFSLKTMAAGIVLGAGAKEMFDNTIGAGARLEQEQVAMKHFIGNSNKKASSVKVQNMTDNFIDQLRVNANVTPFGTNEVLAAGRRAINIVNGNTGKSMDLVNLAENMAALNPGKSVMDAMEALADMKTGEFERMKEFGFKFSQAQFKGLVGKGEKDDLTDAEMNKAYDMTVKSKLNPVFAGGAKELSQTTAGQWSTTTGNIESMLSDVGKVFLPAINKTLIPINASLDKLGNSKAFAELQKEMGNLANAGGQKVQAFLKTFEDPKKVKEYKEIIKTMVGDIKAVGTVGISYIKGISSVLMPVIKLAAAHPKVIAGLFAGITVGKGALNAVSTFNSIRKEFPIINTAAKAFGRNFTGSLKGIGSVFVGAGKGVTSFAKLVPRAFNTVSGTTKLWVGTIGSVLKTKLVSSARTGFSGVVNITKLFGRNLGSALRSAGSIASIAGKNIIGFAKMIPGGLNTVLGTVKLWVGTLGSLLKSRLLTVIRTTASGIMGIIRPLFLFIAANPIVLIIGAVIGACVLLYQAWKHNWGGIQDKTHAVIDFVKGKIAGINETFEYIKQKIADFKAAVEEKWNAIKEFFSHPIQGTVKLAQQLLGKGVDKGKALGTSYYEGGPTWVGEHGPEIFIPPQGSKILTNRQSMSMINTASNMMAPNMNLTSGVTKQSKSMAPQATKWGEDIPESLAKGIKSNTKTVTDSVTVMASKIRELIHFSVPDKGPLSDADTYGIDMMKTFGTGIQNNTKLVTTPTTNMSGNVKTIFNNLSTQSLSYGHQVVNQLGLGIQSSASNLSGIVKTLTDKVINQFKTGFGIHSPSVVMHKIGAFLMQGLVNGMSSKDVAAFIKNWIGDITGVAGGTMGGNVTEWLTGGLGITGTPMSWLPGLIQLVKRESGGNPMAYNGISVGGEHATGLMQMLGSTFRSYALPGLNNILNPIANVASAVRYIKATYGSVMNIPNLFAGNYKGYAVGLTRVPKDNFPALLHEDERVLTANEARNYNRKNSGIRIIIQKLADKIEFKSEAEMDKFIDKLVKKLEKVAYNMA